MPTALLRLTLPILLLLSTYSLAESLKLATTTSTENSGLLAYLFPILKQETGITVDYTAVGSGVALKLGREGKVDALLVHSPASEQEYMSQGYGLERTFVFFNDFVLVGPKEIPDADSLKASLTIIANQEMVFISRADNSGTHKKEQALWHDISFDPIGEPWYIEAGIGMGATLIMADRERGYLLIDRGTWIAKGDSTTLTVVFENDHRLLNQYSVIVNNPEMNSINVDVAQKFSNWLSKPTTQNLIKNFRIRNKVLFKPVSDY